MRSPIVSSYIELPWNIGVLILYISDIKSCEFVKQNSAESFARATKNGMAATAGEGLLRVLCIHVFCISCVVRFLCRPSGVRICGELRVTFRRQL